MKSIGNLRDLGTNGINGINGKFPIKRSVTYQPYQALPINPIKRVLKGTKGY